MGEKHNRVLVAKPEGKTPLERPRHRWRIVLKCIVNKYDGRS
jgi:hypothetical protein